MGDVIQPVRKELDRVVKRQRQAAAKTSAALDAMMQQLQAARAAIETNSSPSTALVTAGGRIEEEGRVIADELKELYTVLAKLGKLVDKSFRTDIGKLSVLARGAVDMDVINTTIAQHYLRQGRFTIGEQFATAAGVTLDESNKAAFQQMHNILLALRQRNVFPALEWAQQMRSRLNDDMALEFRLHTLQFIQTLATQGTAAALIYAKQRLDAFSPKHMAAIQRLMGCLLYARRLEHSPYADLLAPHHWQDVEQQFTRASCAMMGLSHESQHYICMTAGTIAMPVLLKMIKVMEMSKTEWTQQDELPTEVNLGPAFTFHSIFVCPVSKEQATESNPAMILTCGHVLCEETVSKLAKGPGRMYNRGGDRFKCPYCPAEITKALVKRVYF